jgi:hypothetical protein
MVRSIVLGLQGGQADGTEATFDGQPMQPGNHLRWGFRAELGFPQNGFWLCRRVAQAGEKAIPIPTRLQTFKSAAGVASASVSSGPEPNDWQVEIRPPLDSLTICGRAAEGRTELKVKTYSQDSLGQIVGSGQHNIAVNGSLFRARVCGHRIVRVCVVGASSLEMSNAPA